MERGTKVIWRHRVSMNMLLEEPAVIEGPSAAFIGFFAIRLKNPIRLGATGIRAWMFEVPPEEVKAQAWEGTGYRPEENPDDRLGCPQCGRAYV